MSGWSGFVWNCPSLPDCSKQSWHWYFDGPCVQVQIDDAKLRRQTQITDAAPLTFDPTTATPQKKTAHIQIKILSMKPDSATPASPVASSKSLGPLKDRLRTEQVQKNT